MTVVLDPATDVPRECSDDVFAALVEVAWHDDKGLWDDIVRIFEIIPITQEQITLWRGLCAASLRWSKTRKDKEYDWIKQQVSKLKTSYKL